MRLWVLLSLLLLQDALPHGEPPPPLSSPSSPSLLASGSPGCFPRNLPRRAPPARRHEGPRGGPAAISGSPHSEPKWGCFVQGGDLGCV